MTMSLIKLMCIGVFYAIASLIDLFIKIVKTGRGKCALKASLSEWVIYGIGYILLLGISIFLYKNEILLWKIFVCAQCDVIVAFIVTNTLIEE